MGSKKNQNQQEPVENKASDAEFATEVPQSKKARKRAARERRKQQ